MTYLEFSLLVFFFGGLAVGLLMGWCLWRLPQLQYIEWENE